MNATKNVMSNGNGPTSLLAPCRIGVIGDFHGSSKRSALRLFLTEARPDAILSVGDLQDYEDWPIPTYFIVGNHESFSTIRAIDAGTYVPRNLVHLRDAEVVVLAGLRVVGLGGIWEAPKGSPKAINRVAYDRLADETADIVITHETPIRFANGHPDKTCEPIRTLCEVMAPRLWLSGHHHHYDSEHIGKTTILSLGKFPHEWATINVDSGGGIEVARFVPRDRAAYERQLPGWQQAARAQMDSLNRED